MPPVKKPSGDTSKRSSTPTGTPREKSAGAKGGAGKAKKAAADRAPDAFLKSSSSASTTPAEAPAAAAPPKVDKGPSFVTRDVEQAMISAEFSAVVHAAAKAATEAAIKAGVSKDAAAKIGEATTQSALAVLDPTGEATLDGDAEASLPMTERI